MSVDVDDQLKQLLDDLEDLPMVFFHQRTPSMDPINTYLFYNGKNIRNFDTAIGFKILEGKFDGVYLRIDKVSLEPQGFDGGLDLNVDYDIIQNLNKVDVKKDEQEFEYLVTKLVTKYLIMGSFIEDSDTKTLDAERKKQEEKDAFAEKIGSYDSHLDAFGFKEKHTLVDNDNGGKGYRDSVVKTLMGKTTKRFTHADSKLLKATKVKPR